jgi:hypothetical protein
MYQIFKTRWCEELAPPQKDTFAIRVIASDRGTLTSVSIPFLADYWAGANLQIFTGFTEPTSFRANVGLAKINATGDFQWDFSSVTTIDEFWLIFTKSNTPATVYTGTVPPVTDFTIQDGYRLDYGTSEVLPNYDIISERQNNISSNVYIDYTVIEAYSKTTSNSKIFTCVSNTAGASGFSGTPGASGFSGYSGAGVSGFTGYSGVSGLSGLNGGSGFTGFSGVTGISGYSGDSTSGFSGFSGTNGDSGFSGFTGTSGWSGFTGASGTSGFTGTSGTSGFSGIDGTSGVSGYSGISGSDFQMGNRYATYGDTAVVGGGGNVVWIPYYLPQPNPFSRQYVLTFDGNTAHTLDFSGAAVEMLDGKLTFINDSNVNVTMDFSGAPGALLPVGVNLVVSPKTFVAVYRNTVTSDWIIENPQAASAGGSTLSISQTAHGFVLGDVLRHNGTIFIKSQADSAANAEVYGVVSDVADVNTFTIMVSGVITGLSGLTPGAGYFLSPTTAGGVTATEPTTNGQVSKPVYAAISATSAVLTNMRGVLLNPTPPAGVTIQEARYLAITL